MIYIVGFARRRAGLFAIGIAEDAFACDKISIEPVFTGLLDFAESKMDTVRGTIVSQWKRENGKINIHIEIPPQTAASVKLNDTVQKLTAGIYDFSVAE